jgi:hypothetical protein
MYDLFVAFYALKPDPLVTEIGTERSRCAKQALREGRSAVDSAPDS